MFLTSGARPRRHSPVLENQNLLPFRTPSASEFGNWKKMESNWTEPQESDPVGLKGLPEGFAVWARRRVTDPLRSSTRPHRPTFGQGSSSQTLRCRVFLGFVVNIPVPVLFN